MIAVFLFKSVELLSGPDRFRPYEVEDAFENAQATVSRSVRPSTNRWRTRRPVSPRWTWTSEHRLTRRQQPRLPIRARRDTRRLAHLHRHSETRRDHDTARWNNSVRVDRKRRHRCATRTRRRRLGACRCRDEALVGFLAVIPAGLTIIPN